MLISPISHSNYYKNRINFSGHYKKVFDESGELLYRTTTFPFRDDLDWTSFINLLENKYKDAPKVHIICHACSVGAEPYSLAAKLINMLKEKAEKFLPIIGKDIDKDNIELAKLGRIETDSFEINYVNNHLSGNCREFFDVEDIKLQKGKYSVYVPNKYLIPKSSLKDKVVFEQADILKDIDNLPKSNTVLLCRNFWAYLKPQQREDLARKISSHFDDTCLVVIGDYEKAKVTQDMRVGIGYIFKKYGLKHTAVKNVWELPKNN